MYVSGFLYRMLVSCNYTTRTHGKVFFANNGTQCFFGISDIDTATLVSDMTGITTIQHTSHTYQIAQNNTHEELYYCSKDNSLFYPIPPNYSYDAHISFLQTSKYGIAYFRSKIHPFNFIPVPNDKSSSTVSNTSRPLITPDRQMKSCDYQKMNKLFL